jgi:hypothetical protein
MKTALVANTLLAAALLIAGCATPLEPGAADVRILRDDSAVSECIEVGKLAPNAYVPGYSVEEARNLTVGLGGNAFLVTDQSLGSLISGVAYRCP